MNSPIKGEVQMKDYAKKKYRKFEIRAWAEEQ